MKVSSQDHNVIDFGVTWCQLKWFHNLIMHAKYEVSISYVAKVMAKGFFRVTDRQTGQKLDAAELQSGSTKNLIKNTALHVWFRALSTLRVPLKPVRLPTFVPVWEV